MCIRIRRAAWRFLAIRNGTGFRADHGEEEMSQYKFYIFAINSDPSAKGQYIGPFATEAERDAEATRLREDSGVARLRKRHVFRANIDAELRLRRCDRARLGPIGLGHVCVSPKIRPGYNLANSLLETVESGESIVGWLSAGGPS